MKKNIIFYVILGVLSIDLVVVFPFQIFSFVKFSSALSKKKKELEKQKQQVLRAPQVKKNIEKEEALFKESIAKSISERELTSIVSVISESAKKFNVKLRQIKPLSGYKRQNLGKGSCFFIPIECEGVGKFHNIISFINVIENYQKLIILRDMDIYNKGFGTKRYIKLRFDAFVVNQ